MTTKAVIHPVILCGGSGTRLWPLSRQQFPKQFVPLIQGKSLLSLTAERLKPLLAAPETDRLMLITAAEHRFLAREAMTEVGLTCNLLLEPSGRNTAPAILAAALALEKRAGPEALMLVVPADNFIPDAQAFARSVRAGVEKAQAGWWVIAGVLPSYPATGYGYIALDSDSAQDAMAAGGNPHGAYPIKAFVEKPSLERAQSMLLEGGHFWNAGIFLVKAAVAIDSARKHCPGMLEQVSQACEESLTGAQTSRPRDETSPLKAAAAEADDLSLGPSFSNAQSISIDYAVLEKHDKVAMVPFTGAWSDVGSWKSVAEISCNPDEQGNRRIGSAYTLCDSHDNFVYAPQRPVVTVGVNDLLIVDTPDALLVAHKSSVEQVKDAVAALDRLGVSQARLHRRVVRPWGAYDAIDAGDRFLVKRITVNPGSALSLQMHHHRAEHWIVVKGTAKVTRGEEVFLLTENQSTYIPLGVKHRLENPGKVPLEMIEVQSGSYLDEDDIVRFSDQYGRA
ncbi:MAG: mannose-1-phosphate guanylyltransferase/mannose-6-phosphate isomerase [Betaproteobacteria bacterium]|nr:mannose-1-phosphate guanylyltransferase/mannose-6-phosphate isomerase [Betaproteobacteria bacterium]